MASSSVGLWCHRSLAFCRRLPALARTFFRHLLTRRGLLILAGLFVFFNALGVLLYVQSVPSLGLRTAFGTALKAGPRKDLYHANQAGDPTPQAGDRVVRVGDLTIDTWPRLLTAPQHFQRRLANSPPNPVPPWAQAWARVRPDGDEEVLDIKVTFQRPAKGNDPAQTFEGWCELRRLPFGELAPSVLWFFLKITLFVVGALVLWNRPDDRAAAQFFLVCVVTLGAYMGGYHWPYIASQPALVLTFMVCGVLLPAVSLHFYLIYPQPKRFLRQHPRWALLAVYGVPLTFLGSLLLLYARARWAVQHEAPPEEIAAALILLREAVYVYLGVAGLLYLACVAALLHSYRTVEGLTERNQVKWILFGALLALVPIGYSLYLAMWEPDAFGAGAATWPMFIASACLTVAYAVSITRYRLMELDQIVSSGVGYFLISFLAGLVYYAGVFIGTLFFHHSIAGPSLSHALTVSTTALVLMFVLDMARSRLLHRRFSRQKDQLDRTLRRLGQAVQQLVDPPTLANRLLHVSAEVLGVARGAVYLSQDDPPGCRLAGSLGPAPPQPDLDPDAPLLQALQAGGAVTGPRWSGAPVSPAQRQLAALGGEVAQALTHEGRLVAVLVLGPKDRPPYQAEDLNLLAAFAQVTALALESARGHQTLEVLNRDLQAKVEKIAEQQRRILALQSELRKQSQVRRPAPPPAPETAADGNGSAHADLANGRGAIIGSSPHLRQLLHLVQKVAENDKTVVLIRGESGTGKELLAQAVHEHSPRAGKPFVKVHCAALAPTLLESELFGHVKGAFTGAHRDKVGRFELANGGTLLLDEIGDVSLEVQTKLLRVLQERTFERVGSSEPIGVDVRILAATHQDLEGLIRQGRFRTDLFYRLNVFPLVLPPLRERGEDIPELVQYFLREAARRSGKPVPQLDDDALAVLKQHPWPGNVRELENVIERAVVVAEGPVVTVAELPEEVLRAVEAEGPVAVPNGEGGLMMVPARGLRRERGERNRREREQILRALAAAGGNKAEAARALGLARSTLVSRLKRLGLE
jgi:transcriptional regulator with GAF, ATPase, and Fis domain